MITIIYSLAAIITPIFGFLVDKIGKKGLIMFASSGLLIAAHTTIAFLNDTTIPNYLVLIPLLMMGIFYSTYVAVIWPSFPLVVKEESLGTAFGMVTAFQNGMLVAAAAIVGVIAGDTLDDKGGYFWTEIFLLGLAVLGMITTLFINYVDFNGEKVLHLPKRSSQLRIPSSFTSIIDSNNFNVRQN